ncbi:Zinc finger protein 184 [Papilio machaon]|uniref:Zinc finger protein 184 n=1 Tax=Papilio machaon TaxID=76193 RepID=A0A0N1PK99_PAPMA|nr:Zinc finger protein 184 [Papilio machaon]
MQRAHMGGFPGKKDDDAACHPSRSVCRNGEKLIAEVHLATPNGEYICDECGRAYTQRIHIIRHLKIHSNTENLRRTFACPYSNCFRRYTRNSNLTQHILVKHKKLKHICNICQADYSSQAKLKEHLKIHENGVVPRRKVKSLANGRKHRKDKDTLKVTTALKLAGLTETVLEKCKVFNNIQHE